jgi:hypothetical protein
MVNVCKEVTQQLAIFTAKGKRSLVIKILLSAVACHKTKTDCDGVVEGFLSPSTQSGWKCFFSLEKNFCIAIHHIFFFFFYLIWFCSSLVTIFGPLGLTHKRQMK